MKVDVTFGPFSGMKDDVLLQVFPFLLSEFDVVPFPHLGEKECVYVSYRDNSVA